MFISSSKTREARKTLEEIRLEKFNGKELLKNFLERELKELSRKSSVKAVMDAVQESDSNAYKFATLLNTETNINLFKKAIELQAKSLGTKQKGLFYKLIYVNRNNWTKSKIKAFLLAKKDGGIDDAEVEDDDRESKRMKNADIVEKLKSKRLSNVLKVFIALVMWDYLLIQEQAAKEKVDREKAEQKRLAEEQTQKETAEAEAKSEGEQTTLTINNEEDFKKVREHRGIIKSVTISGSVKTIKVGAFAECANLQSVRIESGVEIIDRSAFAVCQNLKSITIPRSVKTIEADAFAVCENLTNVTIENGVEAICMNAFFHCTNLKSITIPGSVKTIGVGAFSECEVLTNVTIGSDDTQLGEGVFAYCNALTEDNIHVPDTDKGKKIKQEILKYSKLKKWR